LSAKSTQSSQQRTVPKDDSHDFFCPCILQVAVGVYEKSGFQKLGIIPYFSWYYT
jgi:hypothetical protein